MFFEKWRKDAPWFILMEAMLATSGLIATPLPATQVAVATPSPIGAGWVTGLAIDAVHARYRLTAPDREA